MNTSTNIAETLSHVDQQGHANMVDVTEKAPSVREASAEGYVSLSAQALELIQKNQMKKGDVLSVARIAGIQAAKNCASLIPLCHPLLLTKVQIDFNIDSMNCLVRITSRCKLIGNTGVEMEALTGVSVAALTLFDMCKAVDPAMRIHSIGVLSKHGGKSERWNKSNL